MQGGKEMKKRLGSVRLLVCVILSVLFISFPLTGYTQGKSGAPDKIRIGSAVSLSGPYAMAAIPVNTYNFNLWIEEINAKGGIYLKKFDKRVPVELITYDDRSETGTGVKLVEKLILEDKVDLLLPPWSTAMHLAVAPVANKYEYPLLGPTITSEKLREVIHTIPYFFVIINQARDQGESLVRLFEELKIRKVAIIYIADAHGIEMSGYIAPNLGIAGMEVVLLKSYPLGIKDISPLVKAVKAANVDALVAFSYPGDTFMITEQAKVIGLNPKVFFCSVGTAFPTYRDKFSVNTVEGVMGGGAWNAKLPYRGAKEYFDRFLKRWKQETDRWGSPMVYASLQVLEQAVEMAGSIDRPKIREIIATETFPTIIGPVKFVNGYNIHSPGDIGQWQKGEFEVVAPKEKRTAAPLFPKPAWR
jgi:branched-chain amino acid transport system substrate-binding protein